jgi:DsbC/DsbD-like thiol-disulfide interchange protein
MLKLILSLYSLLCLSYTGDAQPVSDQKPVHWAYSTKKTGPGTYEVHLTATIDDGWHLYSQQQPNEAVAHPTEIKFARNPFLILDGKPRELGKLDKWEDKGTGIQAYQYEHSVDFVQTLKARGMAKVKATVTGTLTFQTCTNEMCLPPRTDNFTVNLTL